MSCFHCRSKPATVCPGCVAHNVQRFNEKVAALVSENKRLVVSIDERLKYRRLGPLEIANSLQNIRRETTYTRQLVTVGQRQVDELRDRVYRRRQALEESRRTLQVTRTETINRLKAQNKLKRKSWKTSFEKIIAERARAVRESISIHRLRPLCSTRSIVGSEPCFFEINGLPLSSIFCLRDYPVEHVSIVISYVAELTLSLAQYLGIKLPYEIFSYSSTSLQMLIQGRTQKESLTNMGSDVESFARALALLVVDIQHLCRTQGSEVRQEEDDLGRLLYSLTSIPSIGQYSDDVAYAAALDKDKRIRSSRALNWDVEHLARRISDDLTTEPFEFVGKQLEQSSTSILAPAG